MNHKINLSRLEPGTTYYVVVGSANNIGMTKSSETSFTTPALPGTGPVITSISGQATVVAGQTETVTVNAYDPKNGSLTYSADWGDTVALKALSVAEPVFTQSATFDHVYADAGTYTATFTVKNSVGESASSSMNITVTAAPSDTTAPSITNIATKVSASGSTVSWTTDENATSKVFYSLGSPVDVKSSITPSVSDGASSMNHSLTISGLTKNTVYYFVIESDDASGNTGFSSESSFTTSPE
jgi:hypothetical protein